MKKIFITLLTILVLVIGGYFVSGLFNSNPPFPTITINGQKLEITRGSYCWKGLINAKCVDTISPPELIEHHGIIPEVVLPGSELKIEFKIKPKKDTVGVTRWGSNNEVEDVSLINNVLVAPTEKGVYIYSVHANWKKGSSSYAFAIEVE